MTMTEDDLLTCSDPQRILRLLTRRTTERKLRLFAVACARRIQHLVSGPSALRAIDVAERFADGNLATGALRSALREAEAEANVLSYTSFREAIPCYAAAYTAEVSAEFAALHASGDAVLALLARSPTGFVDEPQVQADLLRCVIGNPFRKVQLDPAWLTWGGGIVAQMALTIYEDRAFEQLPVLADALQDAGCDDDAILKHCGDGAHARGCWVVDSILGRT